jgi:hypothetical protein
VASRKKWHALLVVACLAFAGVATARPLRSHASGTRAPTATVARASAQLTPASPLGALTASRSLRVTGQAFAPHAAIVVTQCSTSALAAALTAITAALDDCDEHFVAVSTSRADGSFAVRARAVPVIQTASGAVDCRPQGACLLGALNLDALQGHPLQVAVLPVAFTPSAKPAPAPRPQKPLLSETYSSPPLTVASPSHTVLDAYPAASLGAGRMGQVPPVPARALPRRGARRIPGEGLLALTMSAPQTSWADPDDTAVVVQARVDRGPWQQIVLFDGAQPFTYEGFTGPLRTGRHVVTVRIRRDLSHVTRHAPMAVIVKQSLVVLRPSSAAGLELAHAPVLYDRRVSTTQDTPLITYADNVPQPDPGHPGLRRLTYVVTWSHEDAGTGFVPWLEWGTWGRMTDIETAISLVVDRAGRIAGATYLTCVTCGPGFPENRTALDETEAPFHGRWFAGHPILRVATGNNDLSDVGTTAVRFQQALAAPPAPGQTREGAMDRNPWTYGVMGHELERDRADYSTSAASTGPGDPRQYLIIALDSTAQRAAAVGVDIRLSGSSRIYSNDLATTYPLYAAGAGRTVVKVPLDDVSRPITLVRLRVLGAPPGSLPSLTVHRARVLQYVLGKIVVRRTPPVQVVTEAAPPPLPATTPTISAVALGS